MQVSENLKLKLWKTKMFRCDFCALLGPKSEFICCMFSIMCTKFEKTAAKIVTPESLIFHSAITHSKGLDYYQRKLKESYIVSLASI